MPVTQGEVLSLIDKKVAAFEAKSMKRAKERIVGNPHDRIQRYNERERAKQRGISGKRWRYLKNCTYCGHDIVPQYTALGMSLGCPVEPREAERYYFPERVVDERVVPCEKCEHDPRQRKTRTYGHGGKKIFRPVWSTAFPVDDPGYVPGRGVLIDSESKGREYAKRYGMTMVQGADG